MFGVLLSVAVIILFLRWSGLASPEARESLLHWAADHRPDPGRLLAECADDLRLLLRDLARVIDPREWRSMLKPGASPGGRPRISTSSRGLRPAPASGIYAQEDAAAEKLQRRYLSGSLSLEQYVEELGRLTEPTGGRREVDS